MSIFLAPLRSNKHRPFGFSEQIRIKTIYFLIGFDTILTFIPLFWLQNVV